jgi:hypothetical protein
MRITVTGPESSGTSLVSRIFRDAGAEVFHRSATFHDDWMDLVPLVDSCAAMIVVYRDPVATIKSQVAQGLTYGQARVKLQCGYYEIACAIRLVSVPVWCITYEALVLDRSSIRPLLALLGLDGSMPIEEIRNENIKHAGTQ